MALPIQERSARRAKWIARIAFLWALCVAGRLVHYQVIRHDVYSSLAERQHHTVVDIPATRGELLDRTGRHPLAISIRTKSAVINPQRVANAAFFAGAVGPVLGLDVKELTKQIEERQARRENKEAGRGYLRLKRHLTDEEAARLRRLPFRFIELVDDSRREYPNGELAAHIIGSLNKEGQGEAGIEQRLNDELRGRPGQMRVLRDSLQDHYMSWVEKPAVEGVNVTLTVHSGVQYEAEKALKWGIETSAAETASVVVMDPEDGAILAMANYPSFDPRLEVPAEPKAKEEAMVRRRNIAVQAPCEPGSVMKMITVGMAIDTGAYTPESTIYCEKGRFARPGRKPITDIHGGHGLLTLSQVLVKSSNVGVAKIAIDLGPKTLWDYLKKFGMGDRTGVELPGETRGILRRLECTGPGDTWCWGPNSHEYIAFGHEIGATALQLARATAVAANGGLLVDPHLVLRKQRPAADRTMEEVPVVWGKPKRVIKAETAIRLRQIMQSVVLEGTGKRARVAGWSTAGKTGSAEMYVPGKGWVDRHNSSFIGFAPVANPQVVVVVTLNGTPKQGGAAAAPVFAKVTAAALRMLQVPMDEPDNNVGEPPAKLLAQAAPVSVEPLPAEPKPEAKESEPARTSPFLVGPKAPDFRGKALVAVLRESAAKGVGVEVVGSGKAMRQSPAPGEVLAPGARVRVEFRRQ